MLTTHSLLAASMHLLATVGAAGTFPSPYIDFFYTVPDDIARYSPGNVIRSRPLVTTITGQTVNSFQVFFATTDAYGHRSGTVGTVWEPAKPAVPPKILSYQFAEDSLSLNCAPSWAWTNASSPESSATSEGAMVASWALSQGYYVVNVDNEGPNSSWLDGRIEGYSTLDGIRAAISQFNLPSNSTRVAMYGYSGAAHATLWASSLAANYAPELDLVGAAYGGTPVDIKVNYDYLNNSPYSTLAIVAVLGLGNGNPALNDTITSSLTPQGVNVSGLVRAPNFCALTGLTDFAGFNATTLFADDFFTNNVTQHVFARNSLLSNVSSDPVPVPKFPRFQYHGLKDALVPVSADQQYVTEQCHHGADIRFVTLPYGHGGTSTAGLPAALGFLQNAFDGTLSRVKCGANVTIPAIGTTAAIKIVGSTVNLALGAELAQVGSF